MRPKLPCGMLALLALGIIGSVAQAAAPATLEDFSTALDEAKVPAAIASLTGDTALLGHVQAMASTGAPAAVALARQCAAVLARHHVPGAAPLAGTTLPADPKAPIDMNENIRLTVLVNHLVQVCNEDDTLTQNVPRELMEAIVVACPTVLGRAAAAQYLADQASPPPTADAVPDLVPLATAARALDLATDALLPSQGPLGLDALHLLQKPEEFFDHYLLIKARLLPQPTKEGIMGIIDGLHRQVRAARDAATAPEARDILDALLEQLRDIRAAAASRATFLVEERQVRDATRTILAAAARQDLRAIQPLVGPDIKLSGNLRDRIAGEDNVERIWLEYAAMEEADDPASPVRTVQVFVGKTDEGGKSKTVKVAAVFGRMGTQWVLQSGLGLTK